MGICVYRLVNLPKISNLKNMVWFRGSLKPRRISLMIKSMTGYGRGELDNAVGRLIVEIRSVNSRSCNVTAKLPDNLLSLESRVYNYIRGRVSRGQVNVSVSLDRATSGKKVILDRELAKEYCKQLTDIKEYLSITEPIALNTIAALPGVVNVEEPYDDIDEIWSAVHGALEIAVDQLVEVRAAEGASILEDLYSRLETMSQLADQISSRTPEVVEEYRQRLRQRVNELLRDEITIDDSRIAMEVAIMAERCDITEEIVRLRSHIGQMKDVLKDSGGPVGRHLDFILQEINREVNTVASKASDSQISACCIRFKGETEKAREQVQNLE